MRCAINADVRVHLFIFRSTESPRFSSADKKPFGLALRGLRWFYRQQLLSHGLLIANAPLTGASGTTSRRPSSSMYRAPWKPSSPGWNMNSTRPGISSRRADAASYQEITCRSALNAVKGMPFNWTLNPYRGCTHACHYCFARRYQTQGITLGDTGSSAVTVARRASRAISRASCVVL